jgi:hypothetical protein
MDQPPATPGRSARYEWRAPLTIVATASLAFLALSGLAIWLLPFGLFPQWSVVVHTVIGAGVTAPIAWYCVRHWLIYRRLPLSHVKLQGYFAVFVLLVCLVSGFVLTYDALLGMRTGAIWRGLHRWTTVALAGFTLTHILAIVWRDRRRWLAGDTDLAAATRRFGAGSLAGAVAPFVIVGAVLAIYRAPARTGEFPADYELWQPSNPLYAANRPFAPSLAKTPDNRPIPAAVLAGSKGCGTAGCHQQIANEWLPSAHRYAAMDKAFQAIQLTMAKQNGPTSTRYCGGCHDPISLFSGTKNISTTEEDLTGLHGYQEGVSCLSCHAVRQTDVRGNAQYTVHAPPRYVGEMEYDATGGTAWRLVRDFLIRSYPQPHVDGLSKVMFKKPEYCAACHKQFVDEEINRWGGCGSRTSSTTGARAGGPASDPIRRRRSSAASVTCRWSTRTIRPPAIRSTTTARLATASTVRTGSWARTSSCRSS